jgi:hypothetical protein
LEQAAAIGVAYLAAWLGLVEYAQLASAETLVVTGATLSAVRSNPPIKEFHRRLSASGKPPKSLPLRRRGWLWWPACARCW